MGGVLQVAIYKGGIPESGAAYQLDDHHRFEKGRPHLVCGNSAAMVSRRQRGHGNRACRLRCRSQLLNRLPAA